MIREIYAVEISGICNLKCSYCPYPLNKRKRGLMESATLARCLSLVIDGKVKFSSPVFLHLFGEPLVHPLFFLMAKTIKAVHPDISVSTNGTLIDSATADRIKRVGFNWVTISPHDAVKAQYARYLLKSKGVDVRMHGGPDHSWGGQVENEVKWSADCEFERDDKAVLRWNGDLALCCIDDSSEGVIGNIFDDDIQDLKHPAISLCSTCHLKRSDYNASEKKGRNRQAVSVTGA